MSLKHLISEDDPRLREVCKPVVWPDESLLSELENLQDTLSEFRELKGFGRAIAAPQLGIMKRLIAMNLGDRKFAIINPELTWQSEQEQQVWDDCLSLPEIIVHVRRYESISLRYQNEQGEHSQWEHLSAEHSELIQHEMDHLNGILMTDRAIDSDSIRPVSEHAKLIAHSRRS